MDNFFLILFSGIFVAAASGLVGSFLVLRKMTLLSDALSHVALPGIALGILLNFQPLWGGLLFLLLAIVIIWGIENKTKLAIESITGVLFVTALAVGSLLIPEHELLETFFGDVSNITVGQIVVQTLLSLIIIGTILFYRRVLTLASIAPDLAAVEKISPRKMRFLLLVMIALSIAIGISFVGILLMSALSIIPAVTARNLSKNFTEFSTASTVLAVLFLVGGLIISRYMDIAPGATTVILSAVVFCLSLFRKK